MSRKHFRGLSHYLVLAIVLVSLLMLVPVLSIVRTADVQADPNPSQLAPGEIIHAHPWFPNQDCGTNECCPTAVSNGLQFLNAEWGLGMTYNQMSIDRMKEAVQWGGG